MNKIFKTIASAMVMFAMVISALAAPLATVIAETQIEDQSSFAECEFEASKDMVKIGDEVTLNWNTSGFKQFSINGESVSGDSGSKTMSGLEKDTKFTFEAISESGSKCVKEVVVNCEPPVPVRCEDFGYDFQIAKFEWSGGSYAKESLKSGYDVSVSGSAASANWTSDPAVAGVLAKASTVVEEFSGGTAGEILKSAIGTGKHDISNVVLCGNDTPLPPPPPPTPEVCDDVEMWNATAKLISNDEYEFKVEFTNPNDCIVDMGATSYDVPVDEEGELCGWVNHNLDCQVRHDFEDVVLQPNSVQSVIVEKPNKCYQLDWYYGKSVETIKYVNDPTYSYVGRLIDAILEASVEDCGTPEVPAPSCDMFTATPGTIMVGGSSTLTWETSNAVQVFLNNAIGEVDLDGSIEVTPLADIVYQLTVIGEEDQVVNCEVPVKVSEDPVPVCELFTATPSTLPLGGGDVTLNWEVVNAASATITPNIGSVALTGTETVNVTESTTFTLTAVDDNGDEVSCIAPVAVPDPGTPLTCADNVSFTASDKSIRRGQDITLAWSVTDVDSVSISVINETVLSGTKVVSPSSDITYVLTATRGSETVSCPLSVDVSSGGGGGGSSPRCDLEISDSKIKVGEEIRLKWDTSNATEITLTDDRGKILFTTDDYLSSEKEDYYDGSIRLKPTRDTEYTLLAERGSRNKECSVEVEIEDNVVVIQTRDQQPLVAGISLSQVPYTGFEAGPFMTIMFYVLLVAWSLYITYLLVVRNRTATPNSSMNGIFSPSNENRQLMQKAEDIRPDVFTASVSTAPTKPAAAPMNLPTGDPVVGYENQVEEIKEVVNPHQVTDVVVTELENRAHSQNALLSSDAVRHFIATTTDKTDRSEALDMVIAEAKKTYPLEDGWIVINEMRMKNVCEECKINDIASGKAPFIPAIVPEGTGSLAEAIVTGNIVAAYEMIGNRPMFALADAAADLDALYRHRRGGNVQVSDMLVKETEGLSDEKIKNMIAALTGALDGTYTDEASAVKMAIMKAVKEVA